MQKHQPHQNINSPVKGKYNFNNINQYTIAELSYVIHKLRKRIMDKEKYITFLKTELEENGIEYKRKFIKLKEFNKEDNKDFTIDPLLKHEKNIKKKIKKRRRKAKQRDTHPELAESLEPRENVAVSSFVDTLEERKEHSLPHAQANSEISTDHLIKEETQVVENLQTDPMEEISKKIQEDLIREQIQNEEEKKREQKEKERRFTSELYLRKVRKIQNSESLYKEILLGDKEGIYMLNDKELDKLLSTTSKEEVQENLRRVKQGDEKTEDGEMSVFNKENNKKKKVIVEEKKEEVVDKLQPVTGHRKDDRELLVYKQKKEEDISFIEALQRSIPKEMEKDKNKQKEEANQQNIKEEEEEEEKEIDRLLRLEKEEIDKNYLGAELTYYLFSDFWKKNLNNEDFRKKKINRMKKILKEIEYEPDKEHLRKQIAYAKSYKNQ